MAEFARWAARLPIEKLDCIKRENLIFQSRYGVENVSTPTWVKRDIAMLDAPLATGTRSAAVVAIVGVRLAGDVVEVRFADGQVGRFHVLWLRDACACPRCRHPLTGERTFPIEILRPGLRPSRVEIGPEGEVRVAWPEPAGHESRYDPAGLRARIEPPPAPAPTLWGAELMAAPPVFAYDALMADDGVLARWLIALRDVGFALVQGVPARPGAVARVAGRIGLVRATNFGPVFDVAARPDPNSNAYTALGLPLHNDLTDREPQPGLQFFHCLENTCPGGETTVADGFHCAAQLRARDPAAYALLTRVPVGYRFQDRHHDYRRLRPILVTDRSGALVEVGHNNALRVGFEGPAEDMAACYAALRQFARITEDPANRARFRLSPGELYVIDNRRVLHGRLAFQAARGRRHLQGCYVDRQELLSRIRVLART